MAVVAALVPFVVLAVLWVGLAAPFRADGDAAGGEGRQATGLRVESVRRDDRARLTITGHVPAGSGPVVVRVLGRPDVAGPCPSPDVRSSGALALPDGAVRVGWERIRGRVPGRALSAGRSFAMAGTVAAQGSGALRVCVHLVRAGARPGVLRTVRAIVPSEAGITPLSVVVRPVLDGVVVPALRLLALVLVLGGAVWAAGRAWRRYRLIRPRASSGAPGPPAIVPAPWAKGDLPPLPDGVVVPDVLPWPTGDDGEPGGSAVGDPPSDGGAARGGRRRGDDRRGDDPRGDDPRGHAPRGSTADAVAPTVEAPPAPTPADARAIGTPGASARATGTRREARWRARRRREAEAAGTAFDPAEALPRHVLAWSVGAEGERLAAERFALLAGGYPGVHVLHDRRVPSRAHANLDHVLVGPAGVIVADTKHWHGKVNIAEDRLFVRGFDRTKAVDGVCGQVSSVRSILAAAGLGAVPVSGVLHWTRPEGATLDGSLELRGVPLLDATGTMLRSVDGGVLGREGVRRVLAVLERGLPPAG